MPIAKISTAIPDVGPRADGDAASDAYTTSAASLGGDKASL